MLATYDKCEFLTDGYLFSFPHTCIILLVIGWMYENNLRALNKLSTFKKLLVKKEHNSVKIFMFTFSCCAVCLFLMVNPLLHKCPRPVGSMVSVSDSWPGGCEFDPWLRRLCFPAYIRLSPLQKHVRKVVGGFGKKSSVSTAVRKPGNTYASPTAMIWL